MKTLKMNFGFSAVNAGQRNVTVEPKVIATSTKGGFRVTAPVTKALGLSHGDYLMFVSNIDGIDEAIRQNAPVIKEFCEANGLELGSVEAAIAIHKEFDTWAIAKGIKMYDGKGNVQVCKERLTADDKMKFVTTNFDAMLEAAMADASDEVKEALSREGVTKEEQMEVLVDFVTPRELPKFKGCKLANTAGLNGVGLNLNCTDSNVWNQAKADLGDNAEKVNREYDVDVEDLQDVVISDGYHDVTVKALVLGEYTDKEPSRTGRKEEDAE